MLCSQNKEHELTSCISSDTQKIQRKYFKTNRPTVAVCKLNLHLIDEPDISLYED